MIEPQIVRANDCVRCGCLLIITQMYVICAVWPICLNSYHCRCDIWQISFPQLLTSNEMHIPPASPPNLEPAQHWSYVKSRLCCFAGVSQSKTWDFCSYFSDTIYSCRTINARIEFFIHAILECIIPLTYINVAFEGTVCVQSRWKSRGYPSRLREVLVSCLCFHF